MHLCTVKKKYMNLKFEQETEGTSFFRASKSLINADKIDSIKPSLSGRF